MFSYAALLDRFVSSFSYLTAVGYFAWILKPLNEHIKDAALKFCLLHQWHNEYFYTLSTF